MEGTAIGDPDKYGLTLQEERIESSGDFGIDNDFNIQNKNLKLYGGAQYERLLNEFEVFYFSNRKGLLNIINCPSTLLIVLNFHQLRSMKLRQPLEQQSLIMFLCLKLQQVILFKLKLRKCCYL